MPPAPYAERFVRFMSVITKEDDEDAPNLGAGAPPLASAPQSEMAAEIVWTGEAQAELAKIPFFVRGKARRNTESFAAARGITPIQIETLYDARSHFSR